MDVKTVNGGLVTHTLLSNYFRNLVNQFFKILPMRENNEESSTVYMQSLQLELLGCKELILEIKSNPLFLTLVSILQYLIDNPDCEIHVVKREVFRAISICNKLKSIYEKEGLCNE